MVSLTPSRHNAEALNNRHSTKLITTILQNTGPGERRVLYKNVIYMYILGAQGTDGTIMTGQLKYSVILLISNFRSIANVVSFLLGDSPASELYIPTLWNRTYEDRTGYYETSAYKTQRQRNHPTERIQHSLLLCPH